MDRSAPRFANRLPTGQELVSMAESIEATVGTRGWSVLNAMLESEVANLDQQLDGPSPLEHVQYAHLHGQRRGIIAIREAVQTVLSKRDRWLEEQRKRHEGPAESGPER